MAALRSACLLVPSSCIPSRAPLATTKRRLSSVRASSATALRRTDFSLLYGERTIRSVANNTREDGRAFLDEAARVQVRTHVEHFPFEAANDALIALKGRGVRGAAILDVAPS